MDREFINALVARADAVAVIGRYVQLKQQGSGFVGLCPFHQEKTPSFHVSRDKHLFYCFGCGERGNVLHFLRRHVHGGDFIAAVEALAREQGVEIPKRSRDHSHLYDLMNQARDFFRKNLQSDKAAADYLASRGVTAKTIERFAIGYAMPGWETLLQYLDNVPPKQLTALGLARERKQGGGYYDYFRHRVMFPICTERGGVVGFGGRALGDEEPKYLNSKESLLFNKKNIVYGLDVALEAIRRDGRIVITEGYMDTVMLHEHGIDCSVATMGTAVTARQLRLLLRHGEHLVFAFDGDLAGRKAAWRTVENILAVLPDGRDISFIFLPEKSDPDSFVKQHGADAFIAQIKKAISLDKMIIDTLWHRTRRHPTDAGRRGAFANEFRQTLAKLNATQSPVFREMLTQLASDTVGVSKGALISSTAPTAAPVQSVRVDRRRMAPSNSLFQLLCCFNYHPTLFELPAAEDIPVIGADWEAALTGDIIAWAREQEDDIDVGAVCQQLRDTGYVGVATAVRASSFRLWTSAAIDSHFACLVDGLRIRQQKIQQSDRLAAELRQEIR